MRPISQVVLHHNGVAGRDVDDIRRTHKAKGWRDVGYHFVITEAGEVQAGRPVAQVGAHARGLNTRTIGVCVIGNGNRKPWTPEQDLAVRALLWALMGVYNLQAAQVIGHREVNAYVAKKYRTRKLCPGKLIDLDALRAELGGEMAVA